MVDLNITEVATRTQYLVGSTSQTTFTIPFPFFQTKDITVFDGTLRRSETADYTITGSVAEDGGFLNGTVTLNAGVTNTTITLVRNVAQERTTDFPPSGGFNIRELNKQLDQIVATHQDLQRQIDQKIGFQDTDFEGDQVEITSTAAERQNKYLGFDPTGRSLVAKDGSTTGTATTIDPSKVPTTTRVDTGEGLDGGGALSSSLTLELDNVTFGQGGPGQYTNPNITVDRFGRIVSIQSGSGGGSGGTTGSLTAGIGIVGGGPMSGDVSVDLEAVAGVVGDYTNPSNISVDSYGRITSVTNGPSSVVSSTVEVQGIDGLSGGGPLTGTQQLRIPNQPGIATAQIGTGIANPTITVNAKGIITNIAAGTGTQGFAVVSVNNGVVPSGSCATQINAALTTLQTNGGGVLYFGPGNWETNAKHTIPSGIPVRIMGAGMGITFIKFTGTAANAGFEFTMSGTTAVQGGVGDGQEITVQDLTLQTSQALGGIALNFNQTQFAEGATDPSVCIDRVHIEGATEASYWTTHIRFFNTPHAKLENSYLNGRKAIGGVQSAGTTSGIIVDSPNKATEYHVSNTQIFFCEKAINCQLSGSGNIDADAEGLYIVNSGFVANDYAIHSTNPAGFLSLQVSNSHFNNRLGSVVGNFIQAIVVGNNFYTRPDAPSSHTVIHFDTAFLQSIPTSNPGGYAPGGRKIPSFVVNGNFFVNNSPNNCIGVVIGHSATGAGETIDGVIVANNFFQWSQGGQAILVRSTVRNHTLTANRFTHVSGTANLYENEGSHGPAGSNVANPASLSGRKAMVYLASANSGMYDHVDNGSGAPGPMSNLKNNTLHATVTMVKAYDTDNFTGGSLSRLTIPSDNSVKWVRVGCTTMISQTTTGPGVTTQGTVGVRIMHFKSNGVAYQVNEDFASSYGSSPGSTYQSNGLTWGGVATDTGAAQPSQSGGANAVSGLVRVYNGDYFVPYFTNITGIDCDIQEGTQMWLEVVEGI